MKKNIINLSLLCLLFFLLLTGCSRLGKEKNFNPRQIKIGEKTLNLELAVTEAEKNKGLSGREDIADNYGMLFIYNDYLEPAFWMKGMFSPIDIIWLRDNVIVGIEQELPVPVSVDILPVYRPEKEVNRVLEVAAGQARENGWQTGDKVEYID